MRRERSCASSASETVTRSTAWPGLVSCGSILIGAGLGEERCAAATISAVMARVSVFESGFGPHPFSTRKLNAKEKTASARSEVYCALRAAVVAKVRTEENSPAKRLQRGKPLLRGLLRSACTLQNLESCLHHGIVL